MKQVRNGRKGLMLCGAAAAVLLPVFLTAPGRASRSRKKPFMGRTYAHRGLHTQDLAVPENSLKAFALAAEAGYGVELDVQLSRDGFVVVFHDNTLKRVCGAEGRVGDYTLEELRELSLCGTEQRIPLFSDVLAVIGGRGPLIVELKSGRHKRELCEKTAELLRCYPGEACVESFDPGIVAWFRFHARDMLRGQLSMPAKEYGTGPKRLLGFAMSRCLTNFLTRPHFIAYQVGDRPLTVRLAEMLGALRFVWTSHAPEDEKGADGAIFEFYRPGRYISSTDMQGNA